MSSPNSDGNLHDHHHHHHPHHHGGHDHSNNQNDEHKGFKDYANKIMKEQGAEGLLGCGNSKVIAGVKTGQTVLDLGSGYGHDCIAAAKQVGSSGLVFGLDKSPEMIAEAKDNFQKAGLSMDNIHFKIGEMENIPFDDSVVDLVTSSWSVNHSTDKPQARYYFILKTRMFREAARVLRSGGILAISDIVLTNEFTEELLNKLKEFGTCTANACSFENLKEKLMTAGFTNVNIERKEDSQALIQKLFPIEGLHNYVIAATITATKL